MEKIMPRAQVSRDQFEWRGDRIVHTPTGASFGWSYPASQSDAVTVNWGEAGNVLSNGDDYDRRDISPIAMAFLAERRGKPE